MHAILSSEIIVTFILPIDKLQLVCAELQTLAKHIFDLPYVVLRVHHDLMMLLLWFISEISMKWLYLHM